ncbi:hypothetical protein B0I27_101160 [Arcticibacter pallidicorallinus]|uniref:Uncharacterized protein n=1 Tax=Arcticibacter pallidicorallinus TaxID=1259464 RepID=A0A2T0UBC3_9SPHI|nr:hypothetical protein B0I27_101160 [Arcticibacter pallidicorallinus]
MISLELNKSKVALLPEQHFTQMLPRNVDMISEKHLEHERVPSNISWLKAIWTVLIASCFLVKSGFRN